MRIIIDMQGTQSVSRSRGIGRYTRSFSRSFIQVAQDHEIYLLLNALSPDTAKAVQEEFKDLLSPERFIFFHAIVFKTNSWFL